MKIIAIESSCDETAAAVVENGIKILSNVIATQTEFHEKYGGIVPEIAARRHSEVINYVIKEALEKAGNAKLQAVAVTHGPGLIGSLIVGLSAAKALAYSLNLPLIGVNHLEGHIYANFLEGKNPPPKFPFIALLVSGGHTMIILVKGHGKYKVLGQTRDDAVGEAYDKAARYIGLGFPGGPVIDQRAQKGDPASIRFPRGMEDKNGGFDFSYSGLKTAVVNYAKKYGLEKLQSEEETLNNVCASFQSAAVEILVEKTIRAAQKTKVKTIVLAGGVAANSYLRKYLNLRAEESGIKTHIPPIALCTDNAAMIGAAAYFRYKNTAKKAFKDNLGLSASASLTL